MRMTIFPKSADFHRMESQLPGTTLLVLVAILLFPLAQKVFSDPPPLFPDDPKGLNLPPAVPRMVDTNGNVVWIDHRFTTSQYSEAAERLVLREANRVALELHLPEDLPITELKLLEANITPFGFNYINKMIGTVNTRKYCYFVSRGNKFNAVCRVDYDKTCLNYQSVLLPIKEIDTNAAYQLATQWLNAVSMDVSGLNKECKSHVALSPFWNGITKLGGKPDKQFTPIYFVWWTSPQNDADGNGSVAYVELFAPTKTLLQLTVSDPKYILRQPLIFTNLNSLLPGNGPVYKVPPLKTDGEPSPG